MKSLITGATGLVGARLVDTLKEVNVLSRDRSRALARLGDVGVHEWDPLAGPPPDEALEGVDAVFHLAGEPVSEGRWSEKKRRAIRDSRVVGTRNLVTGLASIKRKPRVLVSASAIGFYGDRGDERLDERSSAGSGFLADVCADWEREAMRAADLGIRVVCVRVGIVLSTDGGALARMLPPFKLGAGGRLGDGRQWMSWIHIDDLVGLLVHASHHDELRGPLNGVAPRAVTNAELSSTLGSQLRRPAFLPIPKTALRIAFGQMSEIMLASQLVIPRVALESGYQFEYPSLAEALASLLPGPTAERAA